MLPYLLKRLLLALPVALTVATIVFFLIHVVPGDPVDLIVGERALPADRAEIAAELHLDLPLLVQYGRFLEGLVRGNWGESLFDRRPVLEHLADGAGATILLAAAALAITLLAAIPAGIFAAVRRGTAWDQAAMTVALVGISVPSFWLGPVLILVFSVHLGWFPIAGRESIGSIVLPAATLGFALMAMLSRLTRASVMEEIGRDYVTTARAKGLPERAVIWKHVLCNALNPIITIVGLEVGSLLAGTIIVERVFNWPGIGTLLLESIGRRDYPVVQGAILAIALTYVLVNLATDCLYRAADPRVKL